MNMKDLGMVPSVAQCVKDAEGSAELIKERIPRLRSRIAKRQSERSLEFFEAVVYHLKRLQHLETGHQQASRALLRTGHDYLRLLETSGLQREKIAILEEENKKLRQSSVAILKAVEDIESVIKNNI